MAKRFTDTEIWDKEWFMVLSPKHKCLVRYIFDKCDAAGLWSPNWTLASAYIGEAVNLDDVIPFGSQVEFIGRRIFIVDFIEFQYGKLSDKCKPHIKIIALLKKYGLFDRVTKGYTYPIQRVEEKDKEEEKEIEERGPGETKQPIIQAMTNIWMEVKKDYPFDQDTDGHALFDIGEFLAKQMQGKWLPETDVGRMAILESWTRLAQWLVADDFYKSFSLGSVARTKNIQTIWQKSKEIKNGTTAKPTASGNRKNAGTEELIASLNEDLGANAG